MSTLSNPVHKRNLRRGLSLEQMIVAGPECTLVRYSNGETWLLTAIGGKRVKRVYALSPESPVWYMEDPQRQVAFPHCRLAEEVPLRSIQF